MVSGCIVTIYSHYYVLRWNGNIITKLHLEAKYRIQTHMGDWGGSGHPQYTPGMLHTHPKASIVHDLYTYTTALTSDDSKSSYCE